MDKSKLYPECEPRTDITIQYDNGTARSSIQTYKGCVQAILTSDEISFIDYLADWLSNNDEEEYSEALYSILNSGKERMQALHGVLGAYDVSDNGRPTKPDSEKNSPASLDKSTDNVVEFKGKGDL